MHMHIFYCNSPFEKCEVCLYALLPPTAPKSTIEMSYMTQSSPWKSFIGAHKCTSMLEWRVSFNYEAPFVEFGQQVEQDSIPVPVMCVHIAVTCAQQKSSTDVRWQFWSHLNGDFACQTARTRSRVVSELDLEPGAEVCGSNGASAAAFFTRM